MMDELKQMMMAKKKMSPDGKMSEDEIQAKMDVIKELLDMAQQAMGHDVKGGMDEMHKVSVMAPDAHGLEQGLDMAKDVAAEAEGSPGEEASESPEKEKMEDMLGTDAEGSADEESKEPKDEEESEDMPNIFAQRKERMKNSRSGY